MINLLNNIYTLVLDASFWLVIGLFIGGIFKTLIPTEFLHKHLSKDGFSAIIKAAILGAPLPLCSCGVIPAAMGLRDAGASKSATTSFLVSTPETGVDSVFITYAMMGPFMAVVRPIVALVSAITAGSLVNFFDYEETVESSGKKSGKVASASCSSTKEAQSSCCESKEHSHKEISNPEESTTCCSIEEVDSCGSDEVSSRELSLFDKVLNGVKYAFTDLLDNIIFWLVIGILFAAIVQTFVPSDMLIKYGTGWSGMLVMLLVGIPMYVCATASTPLAAGFLMAGISPGAVIVFLLAGPATNMATLGIINKQMGQRTMLLYLTGIMSTALISGFVVNWLVSLWSIDINQYLVVDHNHMPQLLQLVSFVLLLVLSLRKFVRPWTKKE
ncbi:MAG: SO_0444 family Cu/Zn efflux transporter [Alcanivoracaceae bacterium]|nr:SO_0444 family Cu/Zn efflux transporter [Alcanivoracaceae bacterium]